MVDSSRPPEATTGADLFGGVRPWWSDASGSSGPLPTVADGGPSHPSHPSTVSAPRQTVRDVFVGEPSPPSAPRGPDVAARDPAAAPEPPARARRRGLRVLAVLLTGGVLAGGAGAVAVMAVGGEPAARITAAATAGPLNRTDQDPLSTAVYPFLAAAPRAAGVPADPTVAAVYGGPGTGRGVLVLASDRPLGDPAEFLRLARPGTLLGDPVRTAGLSCGTIAVLQATHAYCAWATPTTYGFVATESPALAPPTDATRALRAALER